MADVVYHGNVRVQVTVNSTDVLDFRTLVWAPPVINEARLETSHDRVVSLVAGDTITATFTGFVTSYDATIFRLTVEYLGEDPDA
jgi:hypothetical protein